MNGRFLSLAVAAAAAAAVVVAGSALVLGRAPAAVAVTARTPRTGVVVIDTNLAYEYGSAAGTGIVLSSSGLVLTNNHVIRGATSVRVTDPSDGATFSTTVVGYSVSKDIALLQVRNPHGLQAASIGNSSDARVGQAVTAVGNAGGTGSLTTVTGRVTGLGQAITVSDEHGGSNRLLGMIETSAPLQPGDSGEPLLLGGRVIGVDAAAGSGYGGSGDGFSIPIDTAESIAHQIQSGQRSATVHVGPTAFLGVLLSPSGGAVAGAAVQDVVPGSAADKAGIQSGDVIIRAGGHTITTAASLQSVVLQASPGKPLQLRWTDAFGNVSTATVRPAAGPPQ